MVMPSRAFKSGLQRLTVDVLSLSWACVIREPRSLAAREGAPAPQGLPDAPGGAKGNCVALSQVWIFFMNVFTSLDIAANSLVASYMGRGDPAEAQRVLLRVLRLGVTAGAGMAVLMVAGAGVLPAGFTADQGVRAAASRVFPLLGVLLVSAMELSCLPPNSVNDQ